MPSTTTTTTALVPDSRLRAIAAYPAFRSIPLDPHAVLCHFERNGTTEDLFAVEEDFCALLDRFTEPVRTDFLPTRAQQRQAMCLARAALATLVERIETGRIDGRAAQ